ncbi:MAG: O-antigen ligase family protein [Candidatus Omnitrophica bacterium]|nr:O-antigen ligase family protein [Candidatus Omnitrophota bacterium]
MLAVVDFLFLSPLLLSLFLILISLGTVQYGASLMYQILSAAMVFLGFLALKLGIGARRWTWVASSALGFLALVYFYLVLQRNGWHAFTSTGSWYARLELAGLYFSGFAHFFYASQALKHRPLIEFFLKVWVALTFLLAVYFMALCFTSPRHSAEGLSGPFPVLYVLQPLAGNWIQPNNLVDLFIPGFFYSFSFFLYRLMRPASGEAKRIRLSRLFLYFCVSAVLAAALLFTKSRAGIAAVGGGFGVYVLGVLYYHRRERRLARRLSVAALLIFLFLTSIGVREVIQEMGTIAQAVKQEADFQGPRFQVIAASLQLVKKFGLAGVGLGNFQSAWLFSHEPPAYDFPANSYNDFLWVWAELGIAGFLLFAGSLLGGIFRLLLLGFKSESYFLAHMRFASAGTLLAFALHALVDTTFFILPLYVLMMTVLGAGEALGAIDREADPTSKKTQGFRWPGRLGLIFIFIVAFFTAWLGAKRFLAYSISKSNHKDALLMAQNLDVFNPLYAAHHLRNLEQEYLRNPDSVRLANLLLTADEAIRRDPFQVLYYVRRAEIFMLVGREEGVRESFELMRDRLPGFYLAELAAAGFYMSQAVKTKDAEQGRRFEAKGIRHFRKAQELHPQMRAHNLYGLASQEAMERFFKLQDSP